MRFRWSKLEQGHWRLGVHIADVTFFVPPKSPLDREARERATSVYLPDRVIPMLPEIISNHLASLQPQRVRFAKTVFMEFTPDGIRTSAPKSRGRRSKASHRFNYEEVQSFLLQAGALEEETDAPRSSQLLGHMHELAMVLRQRRLEHGSLELVLPEIKLELDDEGKVSGAKGRRTQRQPSDHRRVHAGGQRSGGRAPDAARTAVPAAHSRAAIR